MGTDYYVWGGPKMSAELFMQRLMDMDDLDVDEASVFLRSEQLVRFHREVLARYPALEDIGDDTPDTPWSATPVESARFVALNFAAIAELEQVMFVLKRALSYGLYIYDAQAGVIYEPGPARWQIWLRRLGLGRLAGQDP